MSVKLEGLEVLKRKQARLEARIEKARATIKAQEDLLWEAGVDLRTTEREIARVEAIQDADAYPVGTRVRHTFWSDITGTVVESDGTGISVRQDLGTSGTVTHGFTKREWEVI